MYSIAASICLPTRAAFFSVNLVIQAEGFLAVLLSYPLRYGYCTETHLINAHPTCPHGLRSSTIFSKTSPPTHCSVTRYLGQSGASCFHGGIDTGLGKQHEVHVLVKVKETSVQPKPSLGLAKLRRLGAPADDVLVIKLLQELHFEVQVVAAETSILAALSPANTAEITRGSFSSTFTALSSEGS